MTTISTHVLDTAAGTPARGVPVKLLTVSATGEATELGSAVTDPDGRVGVGVLGAVEGPCVCRLIFTTATPFFPEVSVSFQVEAGRDHLHVPLLLSPFGYSVYRGS